VAVKDGRWRVEADAEWLAKHSSTNFARLRMRVGKLSGLASAMSNAEMGPYGGAPRKPQLKLGGRAYAVIRYAHHRLSYTTVRVELERCPRCGRPMVEAHNAARVRADGGQVSVGTVRKCRRCDADSWLFASRLPATTRARIKARKVVL
jgi:RNase P subunit RPR2